MDLNQDLSHPFVVRDFTGPLDLLLHLIRTHEMDIADIPIVPLVEQYQRYLDVLEELNLTIASEYLHMLAILLSIKVRMLLPRTEEEIADPGTDPRRDLIAQLLDYEKIKAAADDLHERFSLWSGVLGRPEPEEEAVLGEVSLYDLVDAFHKVLKARKDREGPAFIPLPRPQVKDLMGHILAFLPRTGKPFPLLDVLLQLRNAMEVITAFLATLELCRLGCVRLQQKEAGAEISLVYLKEIPTDLTFVEYL